MKELPFSSIFQNFREAASLFTDTLAYAAALEKETPKIDYFATSLPAMLLFEEDLRKRQYITATFLKALALLGLMLLAIAIALRRFRRKASLFPRAYDANNALIPNQTFTWSSDMPGVASVSGTGDVMAVTAGGPVHIMAKDGNISGMAVIVDTAATILPPATVKVVPAVVSNSCVVVSASAEMHDVLHPIFLAMLRKSLL